MDLSIYPELDEMYEYYMTSDGVEYHICVFTATDSDDITKEIVFYFPNDIVTPETEALVRAMASSVKVK
ncbi:hypothetical protein [Alkalihalobacillus deserti]|uniref:hypothetical protein n=1 Tax=Alkalihalobacillus deserti TaxID=2879466 RepID=UPI001D15BBF2|nr:hypothetical protein [Alkalihalobacillus deserti]